MRFVVLFSRRREVFQQKARNGQRDGRGNSPVPELFLLERRRVLVRRARMTPAASSPRSSPDHRSERMAPFFRLLSEIVFVAAATATTDIVVIPRGSTTAAPAKKSLVLLLLF